MKMIKPDVQRGAAARPLPHALPAAPHAAAHRAGNLGVLVGESAARAAASASASAAAFVVSPKPRTWDEWLALQGAVAQRLAQLQQGWIHGWRAWLQDCPHLQRANRL